MLNIWELLLLLFSHLANPYFYEVTVCLGSVSHIETIVVNEIDPLGL